MNNQRVVASWSGGIDSTAVVANLLKRGYEVLAAVLDIYPHHKNFSERERAARRALAKPLLEVAQANGGKLIELPFNADWIWAFSADDVEIPRRNKHIMDFLLIRVGAQHAIKNIALGEYTGADTWLVRDHVGSSDADHRALAAYLYLEYGIDYRLISLQDFGESRYKSDRLKLGIEALGLDGMRLTTNCLMNEEIHCGACYKCAERAAAFAVLGLEDTTEYAKRPQENERFGLYMRQMAGENVTSSFHQ